MSSLQQVCLLIYTPMKIPKRIEALIEEGLVDTVIR